MFFILSKIFAVILHPIHMLMILLMLAIVFKTMIKWQKPPKRRRLFSLKNLHVVTLMLAVFLSFNLVIPILPYQAVKVLEHRFERPDPEDLNPSVIIILGGWQGAGASFTTADAPPIGSAGDRLIAGLILSKKFPDAKVYFPGGLRLQAGSASEDEMTRAVISGLELQSSRFIIEGESRNTAENASYIRAMVDDLSQDQVVLITSASHMPRAMGSFRAAGINPVAYPVDHQTSAEGMPWSLIYKAGNNLSGIALHEWVGLLAYRLTGRSADLLPKP